jgi:hypothetical protein
MVVRFFEIKPHIDKMAQEDDIIHQMIPSPKETKELIALKVQLDELWSVMMKLQVRERERESVCVCVCVCVCE